MLVLTRQTGQQIVLSDQQGNEIATVMIVRVSGGQVKLGISAGQEIKVDRKETREQKTGADRIATADTNDRVCVQQAPQRFSMLVPAIGTSSGEG